MLAFDPGTVAGMTRGGIDNVDHVDGRPGLVFHPKPTIVPHGAPIIVSGWTVDPATDAAPQAVAVLLDRARPFFAVSGIARGDVMLKYGTDEFVGFQLVVDTTDLSPGAHELRAYALARDGFWYESAAAGFRLYHHAVTALAARLDRPLRIALDSRIDLTAGRAMKFGAPLPANHWLQLQGWTFDHATRGGAARIAAIADDGRAWSGPSNMERADAGAAMLIATSQLGFEILVPAAVFPRGTHRLQIVGFDDAGRQYRNSMETTIDVIAAERPFPLVARCALTPVGFGARLRIVERIDGDECDDVEDDDAERTIRTIAVPGASVEAKVGTDIRIDGWALDEGGRAADEVFVEATALWAKVPPQRLITACGWKRSTEETPVSGGIEGSYFTFRIASDELTAGPYELAIIVVQPGRCAYTRATIATITVRQ